MMALGLVSMAQAISCPHCQKSLRVPDDKIGARVKCPACGQPFRVELPTADNEFDELLESEPPPLARTAQRATRGAASDSGYPIKPFLKTWGTILGGIIALAVVIGLVGLAAEPAAMVSTGICVAAIIGCVAVGRIWMSIDLGREVVWKGLVSFFVPLVGLALTMKQRGPSMRGAVVYLSALAPAVVGLGLLLMFKPLYTAEGRAAARAETAEDRLRQLESRVDLSEPAESVTYSISGRLDDAGSIAGEIERLLSDYPMYVAGSARLDVSARTLTIEARGGRIVAVGFAMLLQNRLRIIVRPPVATSPETSSDTTAKGSQTSNEDDRQQ